MVWSTEIESRINTHRTAMKFPFMQSANTLNQSLCATLSGNEQINPNIWLLCKSVFSGMCVVLNVTRISRMIWSQHTARTNNGRMHWEAWYDLRWSRENNSWTQQLMNEGRAGCPLWGRTEKEGKWKLPKLLQSMVGERLLRQELARLPLPLKITPHLSKSTTTIWSLVGWVKLSSTQDWRWQITRDSRPDIRQWQTTFTRTGPRTTHTGDRIVKLPHNHTPTPRENSTQRTTVS